MIQEMMGIEEKQTILNLIMAGNYILTHHAYTRMQERSITDGDILECARTAVTVETQSDGKFKIKGLDLTEIETTIVCAFKNDVVIITVF